MTWATAVEAGRIANIAMASGTLLLLAATVRRWRFRSAGNRFLWMAVVAFLGNSIFGTAEQMHQASPGGWRTAVTTVSIVWMTAALWLKRTGRWYSNEYAYSHDGQRGDDGLV